MAKKAEIKKKNISINTEEPIEEKDIDAVALPDEESEEEDGLELDDDVVDPFGDKWEQ